MNIIAIDIGNSSINMGFFVEGELIASCTDTLSLMSESDFAAFINGILKEKNIEKPFAGGIISSVVPAYTEAVKRACIPLCIKEPLILSYKLNTGIEFKINEPEKLGTDRIAASAGACALFGSPVAVIDFGTATTINFLGRGNVYIGGAIMPGLRLLKEALFKETAQLPNIDISRPLTPLGRDTRSNILSGIIYGTAGAVERILTEVEKAEGGQYSVVAAGGFSELIAPFIQRVDHLEPALVLKGLKVIYERNT